MPTRFHDSNEKRTFPRYKVSDSSAVMLTPGNIVSYCILDVSKSGLAFCYNGAVNESEMLDNALITFFTENLGSSDIAVQIVCDTELNEKMAHQSQENRAKTPYLRRCGVKFKQLSREQESTISSYIEHLTTTVV
jgi:c-di-GMP-binding flagellar brake protein YcgR